MTASPSLRQRAKELVDKLPGDALRQVVALMESLSDDVPSTATALDDQGNQERSLLVIIHRQLTPADQARLSYLREQQEAETITDEEHQELLAYVEQLEQHDAERAAALVQLAKIRQTNLETLLNEYLPSRLPNGS